MNIAHALPLLLTACIHRVPDHLRVEPSADQVAEQLSVTNVGAALAAMTRKDPLARSPLLLSSESVGKLEGGGPVAEWIRTVRELERGDGQVDRTLQQLEHQYPETAVVPLSRGYRLRLAENRLASADGEPDATSQLALLGLLTPLHGATLDETLPVPALEWLKSEGRMTDRVRAYGDRWVLASWLHAPGIPLDAVGAALSAPMYDGLAQTPTGALVTARFEKRDGPVEPHLDHLGRATLLALHRAAADRDKEQAEWATMKAAASAELDTHDPITLLLQRARVGLTDGAVDDRAVGGALIAIGALRWMDTCPDVPCEGLDRVETFRAAGQWSEVIAPLAATWRVIALKEALDTMDVGHGTVLFPKAILSLADALVGTGAGPLEAQLLMKRSPDGAVWLSLGRSVGAEAVTDWQGTRVALGAHLERISREALASNPPTSLVPLLERVASRAIP